MEARSDMTRRRGGCQESPVTIQTVANLVLLWGWSSAEKGGSTQRGGPQHPCQAGLDWACTRTQDGFEPAARSRRVRPRPCAAPPCWSTPLGNPLRPGWAQPSWKPGWTSQLGLVARASDLRPSGPQVLLAAPEV